MVKKLTIKHSIVLISFPFDDFSSSKVRPALCLTSEIGKYDHVIIAFISSKIPKKTTLSDCVILKNSENWKGTGLSVDSVVRLHKIVSVTKKLIKRRLGNINQNLKREVTHKITELFKS